MTEKIIEIKDLCFSYQSEMILENIHLDVYKNDFLAIIGPNGGGKTTLLKIMLGLLKANKGEVLVFSKKPSHQDLKNKVAYVPQFGDYAKDFPISVEKVVLQGLLTSKDFLPFFSKQDKAKAFELLEKMEIEKYKKEPFSSLSGGQKQRVLIARALISEPELLILDEPTASVDPRMGKDIYELLKALSESISIVVVSHDVAFVSSYVNKIACLNKRLVLNDKDHVCKEASFNLYGHSVSQMEHHCML